MVCMGMGIIEMDEHAMNQNAFEPGGRVVKIFFVLGQRTGLHGLLLIGKLT